jgi:adenylate cyclase
MAGDPTPLSRNRFGLLARVLATSDREARMVAEDPVIQGAVADEMRIGRSIASTGRETAVLILAIFLPFLNFGWPILYYEGLLVLFWLSGRLRRRFATLARSFTELAFLSSDILLLILITVIPNPFEAVLAPNAIGFRWNMFDFFFMVLAFATLAYSWRTVWTIGCMVAVVWLGATGLVDLFGHRIPEVARVARETAAALNDPVFAPFMDLNDVQWSLRVQEVVVLLIVAGALSLKGWRANQLLFREARAAEERANLSRYFAPTMVERLARQPAALSQPQTLEVAVLFADLVGFTELTEARPEPEVVSLLRQYYAIIELAVFDHGGTLDKYLGDGVMATFGTPLPEPGDAGRALAAARAIVNGIDALGLGLRVSVGVHFGPATVGDVGPARRLEFAVIGDTVNVASRLEASTREHGARIVVSDALISRARSEGCSESALVGFDPLPGLQLRGRKAEIDAWVLRDQ